jgi:hypothetical protein
MLIDFNKFMELSVKEGGGAMNKKKGYVDVEKCLEKASKLWQRAVMFRTFNLHKAYRVLSKAQRLLGVLHRARKNIAERNKGMEELRALGDLSALALRDVNETAVAAGEGRGEGELGVFTSPRAVQALEEAKTLGNKTAAAAGEGGGEGESGVFTSPRVVQALEEAKALDSQLNQ